jgi:hypothetical protein
MRAPYNRVGGSLRRLQLRLDAGPTAADGISRTLRKVDVQERDAYLDLFGLAQQYGALNGPETATLRLIIQTWPDATTAERLAVLMTAAELCGRPMTHVRHSILGLQARNSRLAKVGGLQLSD